MIDVGGCGGYAVDKEGEEAQDHHHSHKFTQARQWNPTLHIIIYNHHADFLTLSYSSEGSPALAVFRPHSL
jgi:hypothetical protein